MEERWQLCIICFEANRRRKIETFLKEREIVRSYQKKELQEEKKAGEKRNGRSRRKIIRGVFRKQWVEERGEWRSGGEKKFIRYIFCSIEILF